MSVERVLGVTRLLGHECESDPPANGLTRMRRYTCTKDGCGRAVLVRPDGSFYGSAVTYSCWDFFPELPPGLAWASHTDGRHTHEDDAIQGPMLLRFYCNCTRCCAARLRLSRDCLDEYIDRAYGNLQGMLPVEVPE